MHVCLLIQACAFVKKLEKKDEHRFKEKSEKIWIILFSSLLLFTLIIIKIQRIKHLKRLFITYNSTESEPQHKVVNWDNKVSFERKVGLIRGEE